MACSTGFWGMCSSFTALEASKYIYFLAILTPVSGILGCLRVTSLEMVSSMQAANRTGRYGSRILGGGHPVMLARDSKKFLSVRFLFPNIYARPISPLSDANQWPAATSSTATKFSPVSRNAGILPLRKSTMVFPVGVGFLSMGPIGVEGHTITAGTPLPMNERTSHSARNFDRL